MLRKIITSLRKILYDFVVTIEKKVIPEEENILDYHEDVFMGNYHCFDFNLGDIKVEKFFYEETVWVDRDGNEYDKRPRRKSYDNNYTYDYRAITVKRFWSRLFIPFEFKEKKVLLKTAIFLNDVDTRLSFLEQETTYMYVEKQKDLDVYFNNSSNSDTLKKQVFLIDFRFMNLEGVGLEKLMVINSDVTT